MGWTLWAVYTGSKKNLVERALENNEWWEEQLDKIWIISNSEDTKSNIEKINIVRPISWDNIEKGEWVSAETITHILINNYKVQNPYLAKCVDDRTPDDGRYWIYAAWWTQWIIKNILSVLNRSYTEHNTKEIISIIKNHIWEENYYTHSDDHNIDEEWKCGCGDMNLALNNEEHVCELNPENKKTFNEERAEAKKNWKMEILEWPHNAKWVILIDIEDVSIIPRLNDWWYFIYNQKATQILLKELIEVINDKTTLNVDINRVLKELDQETLSTFWSLWAEAPLYRLNKKEDKYIIETDWVVNDAVIAYYLW